MKTIVIVQKGGDYKTVSVNNLTEADIYKKCGFRKPDNFEKRHEWKVKRLGEKFHIVLYARNTGKANTENKFDFPPPIDNELFYGSCALVRFKNKEIIDFTDDEWEDIYNKLMGGFEDLGGSDEDKKDAKQDVDELENVPKEMLTKNGYLKDGFVVDDVEKVEDGEEDGSEVSDGEDESEDETDDDEDDESDGEELDDEESDDESAPLEENDDDESNDEMNEENEEVVDSGVEGVNVDDDDSLVNTMENIKISTIKPKKKVKKKISAKLERESDSDMDYDTDLSDELSEEAYEYSDD